MSVTILKNKLSGIIFPVLLFLTFFPFWKASSKEIPLNTVVEDSHIVSPIDENMSTDGFMHALWGQPSMDSAYLGMWSYHFVDDNEEYQSTHDLIGFTYKGVFLGTFENSRNDRTWGGGLQRDIYRTTWGILSTEIGYRLGVMYGYDKMELYDSGLFPLLQLYSDVRYKNLGIQFSWGGSALTAGFLIRF